MFKHATAAAACALALAVGGAPYAAEAASFGQLRVAPRAFDPPPLRYRGPLVLLPAPQTHAPEAPSLIPSFSLRMLTYNIHAIPGNPLEFSGSNDAYPAYGDNAERARHIANRVIALHPRVDIVAFNEVWDGDARDALVNTLHDGGPFAHYVDGSGTSLGGLMLFSRYPFEPLPYEVGWGDPVNHMGNDGFVNLLTHGHGIVNNGQPASVNHVEFDDCDGTFTDCMAAKGAILARIRHPIGRSIYVVVTHMDATDDGDVDDAHEARWTQGGQIAQLLAELGPMVLSEDLVLVAGDLNINGNLASAKLLGGTVHTEWHQFFDPLLMVGESQDYFKANGSNVDCFPLLVCGHDAWAVDTIRSDIGQTSGAEMPRFRAEKHGSRLDYFVRNNAEMPLRAPLCVQHLAKPWPFFFGPDGTASPSDHMPLLIDINARAPACSPLTAIELGADGTGGQMRTGTIAHVGNAQWYVLREAGTYGVHVSGGSGDYEPGFQLFHHSDLSTPRVPFNKEYDHERRAWKYLLDKPPYFIKVQLRDKVEPGNSGAGRYDTRRHRGPYQLNVHRYDCSRPGEACLLRAGEWAKGQFPKDDLLGASDRMWFSFESAQLSNGGTPTQMFQVRKSHGSAPDLDVELWEGSRHNDHAAPLAFSGEPRTWWTGGATSRVGYSRLGDGKFYLTVRRMEPTEEQAVEVRYGTTLTYFRPRELIVNDVIDDNGGDFANSKDEVHMFVDFDGYGGLTIPPHPGFASLGSVPDDPGRVGGAVLGQFAGRFAKRVVVSLYDDELGDDFNLLAPAGNHPVTAFGLPPFVSGLDAATRLPVLSQREFGGPDEGYWYVLRYELSHEPHHHEALDPDGNAPWQ